MLNKFIFLAPALLALTACGGSSNQFVNSTDCASIYVECNTVQAEQITLLEFVR